MAHYANVERFFLDAATNLKQKETFLIESVSTPVLFNLSAAMEPSANVCVTHGTLCNDPSVYIAATT